MAQVSWIGGVSTDWGTGANWSGGSAPTTADSVQVENVNSVVIAAGTTADAGSLAAGYGLTLTVAGELDASGGVSLPDGELLLSGGAVVTTSLAGQGQFAGEIYGYGVVSATSLSDGLTVEAHGGSLQVSGDVAGGAYPVDFLVDANSVLELAGSIAGGDVAFSGPGARLLIDQPAHFSDTITEVGLGDVIDLAGVAATAVSYSGTTLSVTYGTSQTLAYQVSGASDLSVDTLSFSSDGAGGTRISWAAPAGATVNWIAVAGDWNNAANWAGGAVPGPPTSVPVPGPSTNAQILGPGAAVIGAGTSASADELQLQNGGKLTVAGDLTLGGSLSLSDGELIMNGGVVTAANIGGGPSAYAVVYGYGVLDAGDFSGSFPVTADGGTLVIEGGNADNHLPVDFYAAFGSVLELSNFSTYGSLAFRGADATIKLDQPTSFATTISGAVASDVIDLAGVAATAVSYSGTTLTVTYGANQTLTYQVQGDVSDNRLSFGSDGAGGTSISWVPTHASADDFNGDGHSAVIFANASGQTLFFDFTGGTTLTENRAFYTQVDPSWQIQGSMDLNGDGLADLVWRNVNGVFSIWESNGGNFSQNVFIQNVVVGQVDPGWAMAGFGDFNGDGKDDILWRNTATGTFTIWTSTGTGFTQNTYVDSSVDTGWHIQAVADFNGDGKADILWRNSSGYLTEWQSNGSGFTENVFTTGAVDLGWHVAAVADFNGDGLSDILWRNNSGLISEWLATPTGFTQNVYTVQVDPSWALVGAYDFNGDGKADLLFRNSATGTFTIWESTGFGFTQNTLVDSTVSNAFQIVTHHYDTV